MGAAVCATFDSDAIESRPGNHRDRTSGSKADVWRECTDEQPSARRLWAAIAQICNDGRTNVRRYRHPCTLSALGANEYLAGTPVDIIERERRDLVSPQAELGQQQQNGVVAPAHHRLSIATVESLPDLSRRQIGRQSCELPSPHRWNAIRQWARVQPPMVEVTEKGAQ